MQPITKASDAVADFLAEKGIRHVFGIIGSGNAHLFEAIAKRGFTEMVCVHHEQAAVMAAIAYYRISGVVTAAVLTTGAGSTNGVTGVVNAWMDSIPVMILAGNENSKFTRADNPVRIWGIQGYDSAEMVRKTSKYATHVMEPSDIRFEVEKAYHIASTGRPGPVWLSIPMNIQAAPVEASALRKFDAPEPTTYRPLKPEQTLEAQCDEIAEALAKAERPVVWLGHGIRLAGAMDLIQPLLDKVQAPSLVSWNGIDMIDSKHPLVFGRAGVYGQRASNFVLQNSDFVFAIGNRMAIPQIGYDLRELARAAEIAVVDIDPAEAVKHGDRVKYPVCADAKRFLEVFLERAREKTFTKPEAWIAQCQKYQAKFPRIGPEHADREGFINSYPFLAKFEEYFKRDQITVTDMGTALLSGHQVLDVRPGQRFLTSTGLGEMGFGLPGAIGASFANRLQGGRGEVLNLNCDGGMMMNLQELQTVAHHKLPIKTIIFNNDGYLMIKHTQKALFKGNYVGTNNASGVSCPNFEKVAAAFDFPYFAIRTWEDVERVLPLVQEASEPVFCEVFMHPEQTLVPKLGLVPQKDGSIVSPPLEDLSPILPRADLREAMIIGTHPKSEALDS